MNNFSNKFKNQNAKNNRLRADIDAIVKEIEGDKNE
jgi:hypothetical protein